MAASTSSSLAEIHESDIYEVFISFRGSDVRRGFLSHLYHALKAKQIHAFIDNDLERGKDITRNLFRIIEQSDLSIVIFSQNYPKSEWCLEELEKIHESMKQRKHIVVPVFYEVDPSDIQDLKGNYSIQLQKWRDALVEISNLSGFDSRNFVNDAKLIDDILDGVSMKLSEICPTVSHEEGLFGIDSSIKNVESLLCFDSTDDVRMVGIWGMGGIGKTTIVRKVFERIKNKFRRHCFVSNVSETLSARNGLIRLRDNIICELLGNNNIKVDSPYLVDDSISRRLKRIEVLLVFDDVHTCMQLKSLLESSGIYSPNSLCPGSRIIVTSRDSQVLKDVKLKSNIYEVKQLKDDEALQLLSWHAFGQNKPQQVYERISREVVRYTHGVPLAVVVLGSELKHKEIRYWEAALKKFNVVSPLEIQKVLRISFDGLDREEKNIFLDIACFFRGCSRKYIVEDVLESFGFHASIGIDRLVDKSLLKEDKGIITMHDLLEQMGREIVAGEKESQGQQSRLWTFDDIKDALTNNRGNDNVEAICLDYYCYDDHEININCEAFVPMSKLRFLHLADRHINCPMGLEFLPASIKHLTWPYYPLNYLPSNYNSEKLVALEMYESQLMEVIWSKPLKNLKRIVLSYNEKLISISDLAMAPNLEKLMLMGCENLVEVGTTLENLNKLSLLDVGNCKSLSYLPELPSGIKEMELEGSGLRRLPSTIWRLTYLKQLSLIWCERLESLPSCVSAIPSLEKISLLYCSNLKKLPEDFGNLESLKELDASYSGLRGLPRSIQNLKKLIKLFLTGCKELHSLPALPSNLEVFDARECVSLSVQVSSSLLDQYFWKVHSQPTKAHRLCVNGNQVPEWMMYRNGCGSSVSLELHSLRHSINFILCCVFSSNCGLGCFGHLELAAILQSDEISETKRYFGVEVKKYCIGDRSLEEASDVFLWNCNLDCESVKEVLFKSTSTECEHGKIVKCGVHPFFHYENYRKRTQPDHDEDPNVDLDLHL